MDTARSRVVDRNPRRTGVQLSHEALETDIRYASSGSDKAACRVLTALAGEDRHVQSWVGAVILRTAEKDFWRYLLEFAAVGTWAGRKPALPATVAHRDLRRRVTGLFLSRQDNVSVKARADALVEALSGRDAEGRRLALDVLCLWNRPVQSEAVLPLLHDQDTGIRLRAARLLGRMADSVAVPALMEVLGHHDDLLAGDAADALARIGEPALDPLTIALHHDDAHVRWHAAKALSQMAHPRAAEALISALNDQDFGVRWLAAEGLVALGTAGLYPLLRALRRDPMTPWVAEGAIHVLKNLKDPSLMVLLDDLEKRLWDSYANVQVPIEADRVLRKLEEAYPV